MNAREAIQIAVERLEFYLFRSKEMRREIRDLPRANIQEVVGKWQLFSEDDEIERWYQEYQKKLSRLWLFPVEMSGGRAKRLIWVLAETGVKTKRRAIRACKPSFQDWVAYKRGKERRKKQEVIRGMKRKIAGK